MPGMTCVANRIRDRQADEARQLGCLARGAKCERLRRGSHLAGVLQHAGPSSRQDQPFPDPLEQGDGELFLKGGHLPRQGRLAQTELARRRGQGPRFGVARKARTQFQSMPSMHV